MVLASPNYIYIYHLNTLLLCAVQTFPQQQCLSHRCVARILICVAQNISTSILLSYTSASISFLVACRPFWTTRACGHPTAACCAHPTLNSSSSSSQVAVQLMQERIVCSWYELHNTAYSYNTDCFLL